MRSSVACSDVEMWLRLCAVGDVGYVDEVAAAREGTRSGSTPYDESTG